MAAAIHDATGVTAELIEGGGGIFDVKQNGELLYSKHETGEFPTHEEILAKLPSV